MIVLLLCAAAVLLIVISAAENKKPGTMKSKQLVVIDGDGPIYLLDGGELFSYNGEGFDKIELEGKLVQLFGGGDNHVSGLFEDGTIYYNGPIEWEKGAPYTLTMAAHLSMAQKLIELNESMSFCCLGGGLLSMPMVLTDSNVVLVPQGIGEEYESEGHEYEAELDLPEKAVYVSGSFILTENGNVYYCPDVLYHREPYCAYDGGDAVVLYGNLAVTTDGDVVRINANSLFAECEFAGWDDVEDAVTDGSDIIGLTNDGRIRFYSDDAECMEQAGKELSSWSGIEAITVNNGVIYALTENGNILEYTL